MDIDYGHDVMIDHPLGDYVRWEDVERKCTTNRFWSCQNFLPRG